MGLLCFAASVEDTLPGVDTARIRAGIASFLLYIPFIGWALQLLGAVNASRQTLIDCFARGQSVCIVPGGIAAIFYSDPDEERIYIEKRKGFCRLALQHGTPLVPIYAFGSTQLLDVFPKSHDGFFARMSRQYKIALMLFYGRYGLPIPRPHPLVFVMGEPLPVEKIDDPTPKQVNELHTAFVESIRSLYYRHRDSVPGYEKKELQIC